MDGRCQLFGDLLVDTHDEAAFIIPNLFQGDSSDDAVPQRLDDLARLNDRLDIDPLVGAAVGMGDDHILGNIDQTARQVPGIGCLQGGISQAFASAVGGDKVLQYVEPFAKVGGDGGFNDFTARFRHQAAHAR